MEVILGVGAQQAVRPFQRDAMSDAGQDIVQGSIVGSEIVDIAGCHKAQFVALRQISQSQIQPPIVPFVMALQFKEEMIAPEDASLGN
jgi:hypothetical protein